MSFMRLKFCGFKWVSVSRLYWTSCMALRDGVRLIYATFRMRDIIIDNNIVLKKSLYLWVSLNHFRCLEEYVKLFIISGLRRYCIKVFIFLVIFNIKLLLLIRDDYHPEIVARVFMHVSELFRAWGLNEQIQTL